MPEGKLNNLLKLVLVAAAMIIGSALLPAETKAPVKAAVPVPTLSIADKIALQALEQKKQEAQTAYNQAQAAEMTVEREFATNHVGYYVNAQSFAVEADKM